MSRSRSTIRWRLTAFYSVMFGVCGIALMVIGFAVVRATLLNKEENANRLAIEAYGFTEEQVDFVRNIPVPEPPTGRPAENVGDVLNGIQSDIRRETLTTLVIFTGAALVPLIGLSLLVGWVAAGRALRPVGRLTARAQEISEENLHERLAIDGPADELKELADTLDLMLSRLEAAFESQRAFAANVSHELRTPLTVIRGEADLVLSDPGAGADERQLAERVAGAATRAEALLESLLALARSDSTMAARQPVDLAELVGDVVSERSERADAAGIAVELELGSGIVDGDRWLLERLVANLVDNGIAYNVRRGWLHVEIDTYRHDVVLVVSNTGDRLSPAQVAEIVKPFRRAGGRSRPGYGLGMAIAVSIAEAHGGSLKVRARDDGGLEVEVRLPAGGRPETGPAVPDVAIDARPWDRAPASASR